MSIVPGDSTSHTLTSGPVALVQIRVGGPVLRLCPLWATLAGLLAAQPDLSSTATWLRAGGALVLAELLWGMTWQSGRHGRRDSRVEDPPPVSLPFWQPSSPAGALRLWLNEVTGRSMSELAIGFFVSLFLSALLGPGIIGLSLVAWLVAFTCWLLIGRDQHPTLGWAVLSAGLPWVLGGVIVKGLVPPTLWIAVALTGLQWAVQRLGSSRVIDIREVCWGSALFFAVLVALRQPLAVLAASLFLTPPLLWVATAERGKVPVSTAIDGCAAWLWAAMLSTAALTTGL